MGAYSYGHERWKANQYGPRKGKPRGESTGKQLINVGNLGAMEPRGMAYKVTLNDKIEYLPKSQTTLHEDGTVTLPRWLAKKYGLKEVEK